MRRRTKGPLVDRRSWLRILVKGSGAAVVGVLGIPALITVFSPVVTRRRGAVWRPIGPVAGFPAGEVTKAVVPMGHEDWTRGLETLAVYVWRPAEGEVVVYSRNCTDLSCPVRYEPGSEWFFCPCHGGIFSREGEPVAGPPSRPLWRYATRVRGGVLEIDLNSLPPMA
jgi:menaquinol-cytochrome c reductase iron-sulfur subunit